MRRFAHGGTSHPPVRRPGNGYGRPASMRPGPFQAVALAPEIESHLFCAPIPAPMLVWEVAHNNRPVIAWGDGSSEAVIDLAAEAAAQPSITQPSLITPTVSKAPTASR